ncbi:MAG: phosphoribosylformylglycinamidine synthase subunit PurS [Elusimicrobia bacterium]|nr:phosphoribosylformylglycinamidine synthase subunit PurS [Elusimicrobiota bacterium]
MAMNRSVCVEVRAHASKSSIQNQRRMDQLFRLGGMGGVICQGIGVLYRLEGDFTDGEIEKIAHEILSDPVSDRFWIDSKPQNSETLFLDIWYKQGVTDPVSESLLKAVKDLKIRTIARAFSGQRIELRAPAHSNGRQISLKEDIFRLAGKELLNPLVQECQVQSWSR